MTLHEAIRNLLTETHRPMTTAEIAAEINARQSYTKRGRSAVTAFQIHGRTRNYPQFFVRNGSTVSLVEWEGVQGSAPNSASVTATNPEQGTQGSPEHSVTRHRLVAQERSDDPGYDRLLSPDEFQLADGIDTRVPDRPGLYAIRVRDRSALPEVFKRLSEQRNHDLIYVGVASRSLRKRFVGQELRARGHGTFFRSIGAVLGYRPQTSSLVGRGNTRNYRFSSADEQRIISWINDNLLVNWIELPAEQQGAAEHALIRKHLPLLNLAGNPAALAELSAVRAECVRIANTPSEDSTRPFQRETSV